MTTSKEHDPKIESKKRVGQNLQSIVRKRVFETFSRSARVNELQSIELENKDDFIYGHWMSFIIISGSSIKIMLKLHFGSMATKKILSKKMRMDANSISDRIAHDFMREQCNLMAGSIKTTLNNKGVTTGLSIPLVTRGFDEAIFSDSLDPNKITDAWRLQWEDDSFVCSSVVEVLKDQKLIPIFDYDEVEEESEEDDEDGDFL